MKKAYTLLLLLSFTVTGMAQIVVNPKGTKIFVDTSKWRLSGPDLYNKNSGNIGIGTSAPTAQLHTTGTVRLQGIGTSTTNTSIVTTDASGNLTTRTLSGLLSGSAVTSLNGLTSSVQTIATGTTGTDFTITSSGAVHSFNLPTASATNRGALSSANWTTFNSKIGIVTATTPAAVTTATTTATINNSGAFWNANQLQGKNIAAAAPANGQVLTYNSTTTNWEPAAAAPVTTTVSNSNTAPNSLTTTVNGITGTAVPIINSIANSLSGNNLTTTVNGVSSTAISLTSIIPATTNSLALSGNTLTSTVNGVAATSNSVGTVSNTSAINLLTTTVNGITGLSVPIVNSISNTSSANNLSTTVNGITGTAVPIINSIANSLSGNNLTTTVNGVSSTAISLAGIIPATTHTLSLSGNTLTSVVNGVSATANSVSSVSNTSSANSLTTTVNGIAASAVNIINSNSLTISGGALTSTINGVASSPAVNVLATANNGVTATSGNVQLGGSLTQPTTITASATNTLSLPGLQNGTSTDSLLVLSTGSTIKKIAAPQSFPQLLVDARKTNSYSPGTSFATLVYNTTSINVGTAYNTSTGTFTAPAAGLYEIIVNNGYNWPANNAQVVNQIIVNGAVDMEKAISNYPTVNNTNTTVSGNTIVSMTAGQTASITVGNEVGTVTPNVGTGQHVLKIIRLQ